MFLNATAKYNGIQPCPGCRRDAYRTHGLPWAFKRLPLFSANPAPEFRPLATSAF
jgi:hypothetical protein